MSDEALRESLKDLLLKDRYLREQFFMRAELKKSKHDKDSYKNIVRSCIASTKDRHGFIDYNKTYEATEGARELLGSCESVPVQTDEVRMQHIWIAQSVIEELVPVLEYCDDSNGDLGFAIEDGFACLNRAGLALKNDVHRKELFTYCLTEGSKFIYKRWDFHWSFFEFAEELLKTDAEQSELFKYLDELPRSDGYSFEYEQEKIAEIIAISE